MFVADAAQGAAVGARLLAHILKAALALCLHRLKIVSHPPAEKFPARMGAVRAGPTEVSGGVGAYRAYLRRGARRGSRR